MTRILTPLLAMLALSGCEKASTKAIRESEMVEKTGDRQAICDAKQKVAAAFLKEENKDDYSLYKGAADSHCMLYQLEKQNGVAN